MNMRLFLIILIALCVNVNTDLFSAQLPKNKEVGLMVGYSYYSGDLNPEGHLNFPFYHLALSGYLRKNYNPRVSTRYMFMYGKVSGDDAYFNNTFQNRRNLNFESVIGELSGTVEFNFFKFSAVKQKSNIGTPYIFVGLSAFYFDPKANFGGTMLSLQAQGSEGKKYMKVSGAIPFGFGFKARFSDRLSMGIEYGMRKTMTDYIDNVSTIYPKNGFQRGNSKQMDWFQFMGVSLSFRIGRKFTDCHFDE